MPSDSFFKLNDVKRNRITNACLQEIVNSSFEKFKISNVIKKCNIARGSFYYYFDDKYDLYKYALCLVNDSKIDFLKNITSESDADFYSLFAESMQKFLKYRTEEKLLFNAGSKLRRTGIKELMNLQREYDIKVRNAVSVKLVTEVDKLNDGVDMNILAEFFVSLFNEDTIDMLKTTDYSDEDIIKNITILITKGIYKA